MAFSLAAAAALAPADSNNGAVAAAPAAQFEKRQDLAKQRLNQEHR